MKDKINETLEWFNYDGLLDVSMKKFGVKFTIDNSDVLLIWHMTQRNVVNNSDNEIVKFLMDNGYDSNESIQMVRRFRKVERDLGDYSFKTRARLDRANQLLNPSVKFEQIDDRHLGVVRENDGYKILDISTGSEVLVARIKEGINWLNTNLTHNQRRWIVECGKLLKTE